MANQKDLDDVYMGTALLHARLSKGERAKVGAAMVTKQGAVLTGFNGTPIGRDNCCEFATESGLVTKPEVIHAELNCILKAAREGISCVGSTMYVTLTPCVPCSAMMVNAGVKRVVYHKEYRDMQGVDLLKSCGIIVESYI